MDAFLSGAADLTLKALYLIGSKSYSDGLIIGHKRGQRHYIENLIPSCPSFFPSHKKYILLNQIFNAKIIGFYSFNFTSKKINKLLTPFLYGKIILKVQHDDKKGIKIKPFIVEYKEKFFLMPIKLKCPEKK